MTIMNLRKIRVYNKLEKWKSCLLNLYNPLLRLESTYPTTKGSLEQRKRKQDTVSHDPFHHSVWDQ